MKLKILGIASLALLAAGCSQQEPPAQPLRTVRVMQIATGEAEEEYEKDDDGKSKAAVELGRRGGIGPEHHLRLGEGKATCCRALPAERRPDQGDAVLDALDADGAAAGLAERRADRIGAAHVLAADIGAQRQVLARHEGESVGEILGNGETDRHRIRGLVADSGDFERVKAGCGHRSGPQMHLK